ncbi:MAG TPA: hypothetical protein VHX62_14585 [Solirubrobacteraceae bacterium]|jgi:hypothetical protein|nr:hypothetical protein [Solirubrobacteraceae bacterium]
MADWVTISSLATGAGTLVLAVATFSSVRSANRSARVAERALQVGQRPLLIPSREEDPVERIRFGDRHVLTVSGHGGAVEAKDGVIYMALALRNGGAGLAVLHAWRARPRIDRDRRELRDAQGADSAEQAPDPDEMRRQQLDLYIPAGDTGYWQGAMRDPEETGYREVLDAVRREGTIQIDLLYGDLEGGQRTIARFIVSPWPEVEGERAIAVRYWNVDDDDPR